MILASKLVSQVFYLYEKREPLFVRLASEIKIDNIISISQSICKVYEYYSQKSMGTTYFLPYLYIPYGGKLTPSNNSSSQLLITEGTAETRHLQSNNTSFCGGKWTFFFAV